MGLTGRTADFGGTWEGDGSSTDAALFSSGGQHFVTRLSTSDASWVGRYLTIGAATAAQLARVDAVSLPTVDPVILGVLARYVDTDNFLIALTYLDASGENRWFSVYRRVGGDFGDALFTVWTPAVERYVWKTLQLSVDAQGSWAAYFGPQGSPALFASGQDDDLASGGALEAGQVGFYSENGGGGAGAWFDNFAAWEPAPEHVLAADGSLRVDDHSAERIEAGIGSPVPSFEGAYLRVRPDRPSRIAVKARRSDVDTLPDIGLTDAAKLDVTVRPRVALVG